MYHHLYNQLKTPPDIKTWERFCQKWTINQLDVCWTWTAGCNAYGYGQFRLDKTMVRSHRILFIWLFGRSTPGLILDHLCRNRLCINPYHLEEITLGQNVLRGHNIATINRMKTHCPAGHDYNYENTKVYRNMRSCKICSLEQSQRSNDKKRQKRLARV